MCRQSKKTQERNALPRWKKTVNAEETCHLCMGYILTGVYIFANKVEILLVKMVWNKVVLMHAPKGGG